MSILKVSVEFEGDPSDVLSASQVVFRTFNHNYFKRLHSRSELVVQVLSQETDQPPELPEIDPVLLEDISELELDVRPFNCLKRVGINTLGDLVANSESELMVIPNFGRPSLQNVIDKLAKRDLRLREE